MFRRLPSTPAGPAPLAGRQVAQRVREPQAAGPATLAALPGAHEFESSPASERLVALDALRVELYALCALLADATVQRAWRERTAYPPYGLAHSRFSEWGMVHSSPEPYEAGSLHDFTALWKAFVDTVVFHLHAQFSDLRQGADRWMIERLAQLVALVRTVADARAQARLRDGITFVYGGLQFGTSVCVQLADVMARVLREQAGELGAAARSDVLAHSSAPLYRLAGLSQDAALATYQSLLDPATSGQPPGWMRADAFTLRRAGERVTIELVHEDAAPGGAAEPTGARRGRNSTLGCPARIAPDGGQTPIAVLWRWCVDVADAAQLLDP